MTEYHRPVLLDVSVHDRSQFECGDPTLDDWLRRFAKQSRQHDTAATWVVTDADDVIVAYASIAMSSVDVSAAPAKLAKGAPNPIPALLIGRLAVDQRHSRLGLGTTLVEYVLKTAIDLNAKAACKAVVVTALHDEAKRWWLRFGFVPLAPDDPDCLDLYMLTADIAATFQT